MGRNEESVGSLEDKAAQRKQRLLQLKRKRNNADIVDDGEKTDSDIPSSQVLFRNYKPESSSLAESVIEKAEPSDVEKEIQKQLEAATDNTTISEQVELNTLAPKVTSDLKRVIEERMEMLERQTEKAIVELIRERLKNESEPSLLE